MNRPRALPNGSLVAFYGDDFTGASETFVQHNINTSIDSSIENFRPVVEMARERGVRVRGYISTAFGCPYEGAVAPEAVAAVAEKLLALGVDELSIGDTIGVANTHHPRLNCASTP